ncbi:MAG: hypothetical protein ACHQQ3_05060 [Gemmatimonadales bacterium]
MGLLDVAGEAMTGWPVARRVARRARIASGALVTMLVCSAHVGSPDAFFEGVAGPYPVRVIIRSPAVIPARAEITVRVTGGGVRRVTATPKIWNGGDRGAPPPDDAVRVPGDSTLWSLRLWIMRQGSYAVLVRVEGDAGNGTAVVPYTAVATSVLKMNGAMAVMLSAFGLFLIAGLVTIAGAAAREGTLAPGDEPDAMATRRARTVRGAAIVVIVVALAGGRAWWVHEDRAYTTALFRPVKAAVTVSTVGATARRPGVRANPGRRILRLAIDSSEASRRARWAPLVPDHGKLMHLFLVKEGDLNAIAHLHPLQTDTVSFETALPPLPAGRYRVFADVVLETGFAETIVADVSLEAPSNQWVPTDADDAMFLGAGSGSTARFDDGSVLVWTGVTTPHVRLADAALSFTLRDAKGAPLAVEPYLGMAAHAVVVRDDDSVYVHLHPAGTASPAAAQALAAWTPEAVARGAIGDAVDRAQRAMPAMRDTLSGVFSFPYAFPKAGRYRVWVQFRRGRAIRTGAFDVQVRDARSSS